jgi:hypothetical protein
MGFVEASPENNQFTGQMIRMSSLSVSTLTEDPKVALLLLIPQGGYHFLGLGLLLINQDFADLFPALVCFLSTFSDLLLYRTLSTSISPSRLPSPERSSASSIF